jgi:hypothetical protein
MNYIHNFPARNPGSVYLHHIYLDYFLTVNTASEVTRARFLKDFETQLN